MNRSLILLGKAWTLGFAAYAFVMTRDVPAAFAQTVIDTDCSAPLDQPDTTYRLSGNIAGDCMIAADNIIIDGQNLYEIGGSVAPGGVHGGLIVQNVPLINVIVGSYHDLRVENSTVGAYAVTFSGTLEIFDSTVDAAQSQSGNIEISDSVVNDHIRSYTGSVSITNTEVGGYIYSGVGVTLVDSVVSGDVQTVGGATISGSTLGEIFGYGDISIIDSQVNGYIGGASSTSPTNITVEDSVIDATGNTYYGAYGTDHALYGATVSVTDSTVVGGGIHGEDSITVSRSSIDGYMYSLGDIEITDSTITGNTVHGTTLTLTDTAPELAVTPLTVELEQGESFNPFSGVTAEDGKDGDLSENVMVIGSVGDEPGTYELIYSVTDAGSTLFNEFDSATTTSGPSTASTTRTVVRLEAAGEEGSQVSATRVGSRSSSRDDASKDDVSVSGDAVSLDATFAELRTVLSQPVTTTDPEALQKLLSLLLELVTALTKLIATSR